jgi:hypothetical protein
VSALPEGLSVRYASAGPGKVFRWVEASVPEDMVEAIMLMARNDAYFTDSKFRLLDREYNKPSKGKVHVVIKT